MNVTKMVIAACAAFLMLVGANTWAGDLLKPYVLASSGPGDVAKVTDEVKAKLTGAGFEVVGSYSPFEGSNILVVTNDELKKAAASSKRGGYLAGMRVTVTKQYGNGKGAAFNPADAQIQVAFTNPVYWAAAYRVSADVSAVKSKLAATLGAKEEYGSFYGFKDGISADALKGYHYTVMMEYFDDPSDLGEHDSHEEAVKAVEAGLAAHAGGTSQVYRIDIPGTDETVFGVAMTNGCSGDETTMKAVDMGPVHNTGYAPYEILVTGKNVEALYARFRIAIAYLGLPMMANPTGGTFMNIMCAPGAIEGAMLSVTGQD
ncbi:MAG: hypothetical protein A2675_02210 [Candidatus Yonathbacteria bacterium RIFCSPHIGHO2_01_FULL_51_10]|uniref:Uncharacterized protein n=1 Tax=Candidatus Yonathbacteria bacterium RIFCSPHIGHO2_01_FULL_51_10 TaxID=1802723 RepID=A0A1G2S6Z6_9BACT|nr:MAG: hypothetical protein A2675_02210 [Candidatus Yonathbacteria bacterium RIFCSPHIGHO2_01_FULL_51_10]